jgi:hypothetical protein
LALIKWLVSWKHSLRGGVKVPDNREGAIKIWIEIYLKKIADGLVLTLQTEEKMDQWGERIKELEKELKELKTAEITSSQFLDNLTELFSDTSYMTTDEIREDLEAKGIDTERLLNRTRCLLEIYGITPYP